MKFVCISDTHCQLDKIDVPDGDVLIHAGDLTFRGDENEIIEEAHKLSKLPHKYKLFIPGNHDWLFERNETEARRILKNNGIVTLIHESMTINGVKIFGSPWQPEFCNWAFNVSRLDNKLKELWDQIPQDTDVLITHSPPLGHGDLTTGFHGPKEHVGCYDMRERVKVLKPQYHVFGHIHSGYGTTHEAGTTFVNASNCNERYNPINAPVVFELEGK